MADSQQTISVPSLILVAAIGVAVVRYFFYPASPSASQNSRPANPHDVDQIATMFPQVPRRDIMWDLQRNGGTVASTTERILSTGRLEAAPQTFQPIIPNATSSNNPTSSSKSDHSDLIQKYNLANKVGNPPASADKGTSSSQQTWSSDRKERQEILKRRREEMVLNARKKLEEKERQGGAD